MNETRRTRLGVSASIASSALFAGVFVLAGVMPISASSAFAIRSVSMALVLVAVITLVRRWRGMAALIQRIRKRPLIAAALCATAGLLAAQQWLFVWAPGQGRGLPVALGYLIMPIVLAIVGRLIFRERLGPWRTAAVAVALMAVTYQLLTTGGLAWETLMVALGYPAYFTIRRLASLGGLAGLTAETLLVVPVAVWLLVTDSSLLAHFARAPTAITIIAFGLLAAIALLLYIGASQLLPLAVFGLLSYLEPLGLAIVAALILGELIPDHEIPAYVAIVGALALLALESAWRPRPPRNQPIVT